MATTRESVIPAIVLSAIVAALSVFGTLLVFNMEAVQSKADKTDAQDRYTGREAALEKECDHEKEILRAQRETLRDAVNDEQVKSLRWESKHADCETRWQIHLKTCNCGAGH